MIQRSYLALGISILSVSVAAVLIVSCRAPALIISFYRMLFTTIIIFFILLCKKQYYQELFRISKKQFILMIAIGVILAFHFAFWVTSLQLTSIASSVILVTAHPIIVGPISHFLLKERLSLVHVFGIIVSFIGVIILVYGNYGFTSSIDSLNGNLLAFFGGVAAGLYILGGRHLRRTTSLIPYVFVVYSVSTITLLIFCLVSKTSIIVISNQDLGIIFIMAIISGFFGHTLYNWSLKKVRASIASVALLGEPIGSSFFAFILPWIHQIPTQWTIFGGIIIFIGIYLTTNKQNNK